MISYIMVSELFIVISKIYYCIYSVSVIEIFKFSYTKNIVLPIIC